VVIGKISRERLRQIFLTARRKTEHSAYLAIPTAREINLSANTIRTLLSGQLVMSRSFPLKVQTQERDSLLGVTVRVVSAQSWVATEHAELIGYINQMKLGRTKECCVRHQGMQL
jgi:hypothetical protein